MHASARSARSRIGDLPQSHAARAAGRAVRATTADAQQVCAETFGSKHKSAAITVWIEALLAFQAPRARFLWVEARRLGLLLVPSKPSLRRHQTRFTQRKAPLPQNEPENHLVPEISLRGLFVEKILSLVSNCLQIC